MAELVDALRSGRSVLLDVEVRVLFWAPKYHPIQSNKNRKALKYKRFMGLYALWLSSEVWVCRLSSIAFVGIFVGIPVNSDCVGSDDTHKIPTLERRYPHMPLTDTQVRQAKAGDKARKIADGGGLHIFISKTRSKLWRLNYRYGGKQKLLSFGAYPAVTLAQAREKREAAKALLAEGIDPAAKRKADKAADDAVTQDTFENIAAELIEKKTIEGLAETTLKKKTWLISLALDDLGARPISEITAAEILVPLRRVEAKGNYETAKRMRTTIGEVFRFAISTARAVNDPTFGLKGALIAPKVTHMAAATSREDFSRLVKAIWNYESGAPSTRAALKLMSLLYTRPSELRLAYWDEFDLAKKVWTIPASRMKMRKEHTKPLSDTVIAILKDLRAETGSATRVFPSLIVNDRPISENTMNQALRRMGFAKDEHTSHGFRASASSLINESGKWNADAIEAEIAHKGADQIRNIYHRATYWDERVAMADWWAGEIEGMLKNQR